MFSSMIWISYSVFSFLRPSHCLVVAVFPLFHLFSLLYNFSLFIPRFILSTASTFGILKNAEIHIHELIFWYTCANVSLRSFFQECNCWIKRMHTPHFSKQLQVDESSFCTMSCCLIFKFLLNRWVWNCILL